MVQVQLMVKASKSEFVVIRMKQTEYYLKLALLHREVQVSYYTLTAKDMKVSLQ